MKKSAINDFPILDQLRDRWSPRAFSGRPVPPESVRSFLEAARWAPSCFNAQPWRFIIATRETDSEFQSALSCLVEGNQKWAQHAPFLLFAIARMNSENGKENRHALYDTGQAMALLSVQATTLGLFVHQMAGIVQDQIQQMEGICIIQWMQRLVKQLIRYGYTQEQVIMKELEMPQKVHKT